MPPAELVREHQLVEQILADHRDRARGDDAAWASYTGHVTVMWSRFDPAANTYSLVTSVDGGAPVPVA